MKKLAILSAIFILVFTFMQCKSDNKNNENTSNNQTELKQINYSFANPPKFRNDGELIFIDSKSGIEKLKVEIEVASTDEEKARGLMYRAEMDEHNGMLFLFAKDEIQSFYMRNTLISLDIIYVNSKMEIVDIYRATNPKDETSLPSKLPAMYVVEINANVCEKYNIVEGDKITF